MTPRCFKMSTVKALMARVKFYLLASPPPLPFPYCLLAPVFAGPTCSYGCCNMLKLVFLLLFIRCVCPSFPKGKEEEQERKKTHIFAADSDWFV